MSDSARCNHLLKTGRKKCHNPILASTGQCAARHPQTIPQAGTTLAPEPTSTLMGRWQSGHMLLAVNQAGESPSGVRIPLGPPHTVHIAG